LGILLVGRRSTLGVWAQRGSLTGDLGWQVRIREERKKGEGREGADAWDRPGRGRKRERALGLGTEGDWAECGPRGEKRGRGEMGCQGRGPAQEGGGEGVQTGLLGWAAFLSFFSFPFSFLHSNYSNNSI
jgi:hypothetical protein